MTSSSLVKVTRSPLGEPIHELDSLDVDRDAIIAQQLSHPAFATTPPPSDQPLVPAPATWAGSTRG